MGIKTHNNFSVDSEYRFINQKCSNLKSDLIEITEDKLENILLKHMTKIENSKCWLAPLSLFVSLLMTLLSSNFIKTFGLSKYTWEAVFMVGLLMSFIWLIKSLIYLYKNKNNCSILILINKIKDAEVKK